MTYTSVRKCILCFTQSFISNHCIWMCFASFLFREGEKKGRKRERLGWAGGRLREWKSEARRDGLVRANHLVCIHLQGILFPAISRLFFLPPRNRDRRMIHLDGRRKPGKKERERGRERSHSGRRWIPPSHNDVLQERLIFIKLPRHGRAPLSVARNPTRCTAHLWSRLFATKRKKVALFDRVFVKRMHDKRDESLFSLSSNGDLLELLTKWTFYQGFVQLFDQINNPDVCISRIILFQDVYFNR